MKRYSSIDFMRGLAIIGVLCFHFLTRIYNVGAAEATITDHPTSVIAFIFLYILVWFVSSFDKLFVMISAFVNMVTVEKQWNVAMERDSSPDGIKKAYHNILTSQLTRGGIIVIFGYISEVFLNNFILFTILRCNQAGNNAVDNFFMSNIIGTIGWSVIIVSTVYLTFLRYNKTPTQTKILLGICVVLVLIITPLVNSLLNLIPGYQTASGSNWSQLSIGWNILFFFLAPFLFISQPVFPYVAVSFMGAILALQLQPNAISKKGVSLDFIAGLVIFFIGVIFKYISLPSGVYFSPADSLSQFLLSFGGSIYFFMILFYLIEVRGKGTKFAKKTVFVRRFGLITLTLWCLQWLMAVPILLINNAFNLGLLKGQCDFNNVLTGYQLCALLAVIFVMYAIIIRLWEFVNFKGSFEWFTTKLLARKRSDAGERLNLTSSLYNVESPITEEQGQHFYGKGIIVFFWVIFFLLAVIYLVVVPP